MAMVLISAIAIAITPSVAGADSIRSHEWILSALNLVQAHRYANGSGIVVGVIDSGVDASAPDLVGSVLKGINFSDPSQTAGFGDGNVDLGGHGTAMAALIAGHGHGSGRRDGIIGVAPGAKILPCRTGSSDFDLTPGQLASAIEWVVDHKAQIISISLGLNMDSPAVANAVGYAESKGAVIVAAAGNAPGDHSVLFPAAYPGVVAAAGTDEHGNHAAISVTGPEIVLSAPATDIYSDGIDHEYVTGSGTSNSTAIIAGAAALVRSRFPNLSAVEVIHRLTATAIDKGAPGRDNEYGYGELNLVAALTANVAPLTAATSNPTPTTVPTTSTPDAPTTEAVKPTTTDSRWLPITGALLVAVALLGIWTLTRRKRT